MAPAIVRHQPLLAVHGTGGPHAPNPDPKRWIGDTLCLAPGSEAQDGALLGWIADVGPRGVLVARPLAT